MSDWIKMRDALFSHPRFLALCRILIYGDEPGLLIYVCGESLGIDALPRSNESITERALQLVTEPALRDVTLVALMRVWCAVNAHCKVDGNDAVCPDMILPDLSTIAGFDGFAEAMIETGWVLDESKLLRFPNFLEWNQPACLRREPPLSGAERQQRFRDRRGGVTESNDSNGREDKSRLDKNILTLSNDREGPLAFETALGDFWKVWNGSGFPKVRSMTAKRKKAFTLRAKDSDWDYYTALKRAAGSDFLTGKNDRGWKMNVDFFLRPDSVTRILEGEFDNGTSTTGGRGSGSQQSIESIVDND